MADRASSTRCFFSFQFGLGGSTHADDCDPAGEFRQTFLEFLAVVIAGALVDFHADLLDAAFDRLAVAFAAYDGGIVFIGNNFFSAAEIGNHDAFQFAAGFL